MPAPARKRSSTTPRRDATINLRLSVKERDLIDTAAAVSGTTRTEFVLDSVRRRAVDVMLDQRFFSLDAEAFDAFTRALESPPVPNDRLKRLMAKRPPWSE